VREIAIASFDLSWSGLVYRNVGMSMGMAVGVVMHMRVPVVTKKM
jgi:hypothetical protein